MPYTIDRNSLSAGPFTAKNSAATSARISLAGYAGGMVFVEAITGASDTISWYVAKSLDGADTWSVRGSDGSQLTTAVVNGRAYAIPEALYGAQFIVPVMGNGDATLSVTVKG